jgi:hypothetical protein
MKLGFFRPNRLPAALAVSLTIILSFSPLLSQSGQAIQITSYKLEKGPPGGPFVTFTPGTDKLLIGEELRLYATLFNDTGMLDFLGVNPGMDPGDDCTAVFGSSDVNRSSQYCRLPATFACAPNCIYGFYYFYQDKPSVTGPYLYPLNFNSGSLSAGVPPPDPLPFIRGLATTYTQSTLWIWQAEATDIFNLSLYAYTANDLWGAGGCVATDAIEGTPTPNVCFTNAPTAPSSNDFLPFPIEIISPLVITTTIWVTSYGTRPVGEAFIDDTFEVVSNVKNIGAVNATIVPGLACDMGRKSIGSSLKLISATYSEGGCVDPERECGYNPDPVLPQVILGGGGTGSFTWTHSVSGATGAPGGWGTGGFFYEIRLKGTPSVSATLLVNPAPMAMAVTLFVDPDGAGVLPAVPLGADNVVPINAGYLYYMASEYLEVRATMINQSGYTYEVSPAITMNISGQQKYVQVSAPVMPQTMPAGAGSTVSFTWKYKPDLDPTLLGDCSILPLDQVLSVEVKARGQQYNKDIAVRDHPFLDPCGAYFTLDVTDIAFLGTTFPVVIKMRNNATRKVTMSPPLTVTLYVNNPAPPGDLVIPGDMAGPCTLTTWNVGETKSFTWTFTSTGVLGILPIEAAMLWPDTSPYRCVSASSEQPPKCTSLTANVEFLPKPDVTIAEFRFTGPADVTAFDQTIPVEMCLVNESKTQTVTITSFCPKPSPPYPLGSQGIESDSSGHGWIIAADFPAIPPTGTLPYAMPPSSSAYFHWNVVANDCSGLPMSAPDVYFGCFNVGYGNNMVRGTPGLSLKKVTDNTVHVTIPVTLDCSTFPEKPEYSVGQIIRIYQRVNNAGQNDALGFSATLLVESTPPNTVKFLSLTPSTLPLTVTGVGVCKAPPWEGMEVFAVYEFEAIAKGYVKFTTTLTGIDSVSGFRKKESAPCQTSWLRIADPGILEMTVAATPLVTLTRDCTTCAVYSECPAKGENCIKLGMDVKNHGEISLIEVQPSVIGIAPCPTDPVLCPGCEPSLCPGSRTYTGDVSIVPMPDVVPTLLPIGDTLAEQETLHYSWTFTPTALGCVRFYVQATSKDAATGKIWAPLDYSNCVNIVERRPIEIRLLEPPTTVTSGQEFEVSIEVYNPGYTDVIMRGGEPALVFVNPATGASISERFDVVIPTPVTVPTGTTVVIKAKVRVLPGAPIGVMEIRIPASSMYAATDAVTGAPVSVVNTGVSKAFEIRVPHWGLGQFVPNPYRPRSGIPVAISYTVGESAKVKVKVYTLSGELVKTLWDGQREMGIWSAEWDGRNSGNRMVASGIYLVHLESPGFNEVKKLAVLK